MAYLNLVEWTKKRLLKASEAPGRPQRRMAGGWVHDLAALKKAITLCDFCARKFNAKKVGYHRVVPVPGYGHVTASCDGCKAYMTRCQLFKHLGTTQ